MEFKELYIRRFNEMETQIKALVNARQQFPKLTKMVKAIHDNPKPYHYSNECDLLNRIVLGMSAKQFRIANGLEKGESIRPYLTKAQIAALDYLQDVDVGLLVGVPDFNQRKMLLLVVGLGGKTGTRAAKAICGAVRAHRPELPVLIMASMPFAFENGERRALAETSLRELRPFASAIIPLDNELLFAQMPPETNSMAAFERADEWLAEVAVSILRPFACANLVNVKFEHLDWLLKERNAQCAIGIGWGEGENAIGDAIAQVMESPFLQRMASSAQADRALAVVTFPEESTLDQVRGCLTTVRSLFADQLSLEMGACVDASVSEGVRIVVLIHFPPAAPTAKGAAARSRHGSDRQMMLSFTSSITQSRTGIFSASSPTRYQYHNLDIPTYIRQNIDLDTTT